MRKRREIARRADRPLRRYHWSQPTGEHSLDEQKRLRLHARSALGQAAELQRHHQPRRRDRGWFADPCRVRQDDVALKLRQIGRLDSHGREFAEAGVDSVDRLATGQNPLDRRGARSHAGMMGGIDRDRARPARSPASRQATPRRRG